MNLRALLLLSALVLMVSASAYAQATPVVVSSPNGQIQMTINAVPRAPGRGGAPAAAVAPGTVQGGQLSYQISFAGKPLLNWSQLGLLLEGQPALGARVRIVGSKTSSADETYKVVAGKSNPIRNRYNAVTVETEDLDAPNRKLTVEARVFDDGAAFRYFVPEQPNLKELRILNESTQFNFTKDAQTWSLISRGFSTSNEDDYHELTIRGLHPEYLVNLPVLLQSPGIAWVGITEAYIDDWASLYVTSVTDQNILTARLASRVEGQESDANTAPSFDPKVAVSVVSVIRQAPAYSPWRVLMIADNPGRLVESNMVYNLNPPCAIADLSWVKPGKTAWNWWNGSQAKGVAQPGMNNETMKYYIDFSARNKFEYMLIDAGWAGRGTAGTDLTKSQANIDIPMLVEYAKSKNVRIWLWSHYRDMNRQMDEAMAQFEKWGIAGTKIDFMDRSDQWMVNWYRTVAKKAAERHLLIDFHGAFKPDGLERTYPNVLTREGVMGAEYNRWSSRETPKHNVTLAFTRMLAGPMDYTPGGFNNVTREEFVPRGRAPMVMGTRAHQTALYVVIESGLQMVADSPDAYDGQKEIEFLKAVPARWDETRVVNGVPPKYITIARRSGKDWFVGSITDWDARELDVPLSFLGSGTYDAEIYSDGPKAATEPKDSVLAKQRVTAQTVLKLKLAPGGGGAIRLVPVR
jgi:alpha-glucosidase